jgi:hypothetical protein
MTLLRWQSHVGFATETAGWGSYHGNAAWYVPVEKCDFEDMPKFYMDQAYRGIQALTFGAYQANLQGQFSMTHDAYMDTLPVLLGNAMVGATDSVTVIGISTLGVGITTGTINQHAYILGTPEALSWYDFNGYAERRYEGARLESVSVKLSPEKQLSVDNKGVSRLSLVNATGGAVLPATLNAGHTPLLTWMAKVTIGGAQSTRVIDSEFDFARKTEVLFTQALTQSPTNIYAFPMDLKGKATFDFQDEAEYNLFRANSQSTTFDILFWSNPSNVNANALEGFRITVPNMVYTSFKVDRSKDALTCQLGFDALYSSSLSTNVQLFFYNNIPTAYV